MNECLQNAHKMKMNKTIQTKRWTSESDVLCSENECQRSCCMHKQWKWSCTVLNCHLQVYELVKSMQRARNAAELHCLQNQGVQNQGIHIRIHCKSLTCVLINKGEYLFIYRYILQCSVCKTTQSQSDYQSQTSVVFPEELIVLPAATAVCAQ